MVPIDELAEEIDQDPEELGLAAHAAAGEHAVIAELLNAQDGMAPMPGRFLLQAGILSVLGAEAGATAILSLRAAAAMPVETLPIAPMLGLIVEILRGEGAISGVDFGDPVTQGMLDGLAAAGILNPDSVELIKEYGSAPISRAETLWGRGVEVHHLDVARALSEG